MVSCAAQDEVLHVSLFIAACLRLAMQSLSCYRSSRVPLKQCVEKCKIEPVHDRHAFGEWGLSCDDFYTELALGSGPT